MKIALYVISILWIALGTFLIIYTESTKTHLKKVFYVEHIRWLAPIPFIFGLFLFIGALYRDEIFWLAIILGALAIMKGIYLFIGPPTQIQALLDWWFHKADDKTIRMHGLITFVLGSAILFYLR